MSEPAVDTARPHPPERSARPEVSPEPGPRAVGPVVVAAITSVTLLLLAGRYGYHRDELYFLLAGRHLDWGYVDQGPLVPALARLLDMIAPDNLVVLRTPSAMMAGGAVLLVAAIARELGAGRAAQTFAAVLAALSGIVLANGHLLSTTTVDLLVWLAAAWCVVRLLRTGDTRWALGIGLALGVGMLNKVLPALLAVGLIAGVAIAGPRRLLRDRWVLAAGIAALLAAPNLIWQAVHGFRNSVWQPPSPTATAPTAAASTRSSSISSSSARTPYRSGSPASSRCCAGRSGGRTGRWVGPGW